ncbi:Protocadherin alpha-7, partial [Bos mutus]
MYSNLGDLGNRQLLLFFIIFSIWKTASGQVRYSVLEEAKHGTFVGRIAQDLGLELEELVPRLFRVASKDLGELLEVNLQNGILFVNSRIDREELCGRSAECSIHLEVIVDRPLQVFHVEVEVKDINDNPPVFQGTQKNLFIAESRPLDSRFPLEGASDADIGENALLTYRLSSSEYFSLEVPTTDQQVKPLSLVLRKPLDREESPELHLVLTATDRGKPELTGTVQLFIKVLDVNDNTPIFDRTLYAVKLAENVPNGTLVIKLNASDLDEGLNADIIYSFSSDASPDIKFKFYIDPVSGEITVTGHIDFEERKTYKIRVEATDKGYPPLTGHCTVLVEVLDANDNPPVLTVTSLSLPISENAQPGTVITLINVSDRDSGANGQVTCSLTPHVPFKLVSTFKNYYSLVLDSALDRESVANYEVVVTARDGGSPSLSATASVSVEVADVNDNAPAFPQPEYTVFVKENNPPGCHIFTVSARDADAQENALVSYSLVERRVGERPLSGYVKPLSLVLRKPLDREESPELRLVLTATDRGKPELTGTVQLLINVLDANDNAPIFDRTLYAVKLAENVPNGTLVIKLNASDLDEGLNADIIYSFSSDASPDIKFKFYIDPVSGEITVTGHIDFEERKTYKIRVEATDKGYPPLTGHCTVLVEVLDVNDNAPKLTIKTLWLPIREDAQLGTIIALIMDVNVYLIIAICSVSSLLVLTLLLYTALRCSAPPSEGVCGPLKPRLVCSSAMGSWSYSQERRQRVCSGEGPPKTDLMAFSPSLPPCPGSVANDPQASLDSSGKV